MANVINKIKINDIEYNVASTAYATCTSAESSTTKMAYIGGDTSADHGLTLTPGVTVHVKFTYTNTATSPSLCVNKSTAKPIKCYGSTSLGTTPSTSWFAGETVTLTYDGEYWQLNRSIIDLDSLITYLNDLESRFQQIGGNLSGGGNNGGNTGGGSTPGGSQFESGYWVAVGPQDLAEGDIIVITAETASGIYLLTTLTQSTSIRGLLIDSPTDGILWNEFDFQVEEGTEVRFIVHWGPDSLIYFEVYGSDGQYLYNNGGTTNQAGFTSTQEEAAWTITLREDGSNSVFISNPVNNRYLACYPGSSILWRAYQYSNTYVQNNPITIYKWVSTPDPQ